MFRSVNVVKRCVSVYVCIAVCRTAMPSSYPHLKRLGLCCACSSVLPSMFPGVSLPRTTATVSKACVQTFIHRHTQELWLKGLREWESMWDGCKDQMCLWAVDLRLGFTLILRVTECTQAHTRVRPMAEKTLAAHGNLVAYRQCCYIVSPGPVFLQSAVPWQPWSGLLTSL